MVATRLIGIVALLAACGPKPAPTYLPRETLLDPLTCAECHPKQFEDWSGSMHAYASQDPVFLAMNARGQRETNGALGPFCVQCHAPMAVNEGATTDGLNLASVDSKLKGVTCFFCHSVASVSGTHNNPIKLATDNVLRGWITNAISNTAHATAYSALLDRDHIESATLCGSCHDVVNGHGAAIERTYAEWQASVFSQPPAGLTCGECHMAQSIAPAAVASYPGAPLRNTHAHTFEAVDVALDSFPQTANQLSLVQTALDSNIQSALCLESGAGSHIKVILDNVAAGHGFPSGSAQDRRLWTEVIAYAADNSVIYQSGVVPPATSPTVMPDPDLWLLRDCMLDANNAQVSMFWDAISYEGNELPALATFNMADPRFYETHYARLFPGSTDLSTTPDHITLRILLQPLGYDVADDLIASGDLPAATRDALTTFTIGPTLTWTVATATQTYTNATTGVTGACVANALNVQSATVTAPANARCVP